LTQCATLDYTLWLNFFYKQYLCGMLIHELSKKTGISTHTIRFYEKSGLIHGKRDESVKTNNYLHYDEGVVERLELIQLAKAVGFTLAEIKGLIEAWSDQRYSIAEKVAILDAKLDSIEDKIQQLEAIKVQIESFKEDIRIHNC
jgi:MerR family transcriptional regulator, copper efflux regulator